MGRKNLGKNMHHYYKARANNVIQRFFSTIFKMKKIQRAWIMGSLPPETNIYIFLGTSPYAWISLFWMQNSFHMYKYYGNL